MHGKVDCCSLRPKINRNLPHGCFHQEDILLVFTIRLTHIKKAFYKASNFSGVRWTIKLTCHRFESLVELYLRISTEARALYSPQKTNCDHAVLSTTFSGTKVSFRLFCRCSVLGSAAVCL